MKKRISFFVFCTICASSVHAADARWWETTVFYEIFVASFQDSDGDGIGDIAGITQRLDYLKNLGIGGIWLTPIFPSPSYHGYDATDYFSIDGRYGSLEQFRELSNEAERRGIKIILDIAVNHTSSDHPWFQQERDYYVWRDTAPGWGKWYPHDGKFYYSAFDRSMPNLNWQNPLVRAEVQDLLRFWIKQGVAGFRFDAARYYIPGPNGESDTVETHRVIEEFATSIRKTYPETLFIGEIWHDSKTIYSYCETGREFDLAFNFPLAFSLVTSLNSEESTHFNWALAEYMANFQTPSRSAPFLSNHDITRIASALWRYEPKIKLAAEIYFMLPGTPFIYYGEEIGMPSGKGDGDLPKRLPMQWDAKAGFGFSAQKPWAPFVGEAEKFSVQAQVGDETSVLELYRRLIAFRRETPIMVQGDFRKHQHPNDEPILLWTRSFAGETALVVANLSYRSSSPFVPPKSVGNFYKIAKVLYGTPMGGGSFSDGELLVPALPPHSVSVFLLHERERAEENRRLEEDYQKGSRLPKAGPNIFTGK